MPVVEIRRSGQNQWAVEIQLLVESVSDFVTGDEDMKDRIEQVAQTFSEAVWVCLRPEEDHVFDLRLRELDGVLAGFALKYE